MTMSSMCSRQSGKPTRSRSIARRIPSCPSRDGTAPQPFGIWATKFSAYTSWIDRVSPVLQMSCKRSISACFSCLVIVSSSLVVRPDHGAASSHGRGSLHQPPRIRQNRNCRHVCSLTYHLTGSHLCGSALMSRRAGTARQIHLYFPGAEDAWVPTDECPWSQTELHLLRGFGCRSG